MSPPAIKWWRWMPTRARKSGRTRPALMEGAVATSQRAAWGTGRAMLEACTPKILYTIGTNMFAPNASTGATDPGFGKEGVVNVEIAWGRRTLRLPEPHGIMGNNNGERSSRATGDTRSLRCPDGFQIMALQDHGSAG